MRGALALCGPLCRAAATRPSPRASAPRYGDPGNLDLGQLQQFLPDVNFPAGREEVLSNAQSNGAPQEVVDRIRNAVAGTFNSAYEILQAVQG